MKHFHWVSLGLLCVGALLLGRPALGNGTPGLFVPEDVPASMALEWKFSSVDLGVPLPSASYPASPLLAGDVIYFCGQGLTPDRAPTATVYAVRVDTGEKLRNGEELWDHPLEGSAFGAPLLHEGKLYLADSKGYLNVLDARTGVEDSRYKLNRGTQCTPVMHEGIIYIGDESGEVAAIEAKTLTAKWKVDAKWGVRAPITLYPEQNLLYVLTAQPMMYALRIKDGTVMWPHPVPGSGGAPTAAPIVWESPRGPLLYIARGNTLLCMNAISGRDRWKVNVGELGSRRAMRIVGSPVLVTDVEGGGAVIYVACDDKTVMTFNAVTGAPTWKGALPSLQVAHAPKSGPVVTRNAVFVATEGGFLYALDRKEGTALWKYRYQAPDDIWVQMRMQSSSMVVPPFVSPERILALADDGTLLCFTPNAVDTTPPEVTGTYPTSQTPVYGRPPVFFRAYITDEGSGLDQTKITFKLDGEVKEDSKFNPITGELTYRTPFTQPVKPLDDGRHTVVVTATDWRGNTVEHRWVFEVDNRLIPAPLVNPGYGGGMGGFGVGPGW
ncbi:MAG: PQQ-binding-like beta-propeller repeat protein [Armatimonadetes bacterium]|nr:PQQ-binding-like beta-propeller repeat protein [Armatimonadota bacterium]